MNRLDVIAELTKAFAEYEAALVAGDNDRLVDFFWAGPGLVRFGLADQQVGMAELRAWRLAQPPLPGRRLTDTTITAFGADFGMVTTLFGYDDGPPTGRQSQTWVRLPEGWRIVSAHVSRG